MIQKVAPKITAYQKELAVIFKQEDMASWQRVITERIEYLSVIIFFIAHFYIQSEIWRHCHVPQFPIRHENFSSLQTFEADIGLFMFAWIFRTSWPKMGQNRKRGGAILTHNELDLTSGGSYFCAKFGENRLRNVTVKVYTHTQTYRKVVFKSVPCYSIAMGQIIIDCKKVTSTQQ